MAMSPPPWHWSARLLLLLLLLTPVQGAEEGDDDEDCWDKIVSTPEFPYERRSNAKFYRQERDLKLLEIILLVFQINYSPLSGHFSYFGPPPGNKMKVENIFGQKMFEISIFVHWAPKVGPPP